MQSKIKIVTNVLGTKKKVHNHNSLENKIQNRIKIIKGF